MALCKKIEFITGTINENSKLTVPRTIGLFAKCIHHKVPGELINEMHFNDLLLLTMKMDIQELESKLSILAKSKNNRDEKQVNASQAISFLRGGS